MNRTDYILGLVRGVHRMLQWPVIVLTLLLACGPAMAVDALYENDAILLYPGTVQYPPDIDARTFLNKGTFIINFPSLSVLESSHTPPFYETWDTMNYTNGSVLMANTGFLFDNQNSNTGLRSSSGSFDNEGTINCASVLDASDPFAGMLGELGLLSYVSVGGVLYGYAGGGAGYAQCVVNASEIKCPGHINAGIFGMIKMQGNNLNLYQGQLLIENVFSATNTTVQAAGVFGTNVWTPSNLTSTNASSPDGVVVLTNCLAYTNIVQVASNSVIVRMVFLEDFSSPTVPASVYFGTGGIGFGSGDVTIQWASSYEDPRTGLTYPNYLYLNDDYVFGVSTNMLYYVPGLPGNFTFVQSPAPLLQNFVPTPSSGIGTLLPNLQFTNTYDEVNAQFISYSDVVGTNYIPNRAITNLPGRVELTATNTLDLRLAQITGMNYISLKATNQFNGSDGAFIQAPYADLNLASTNTVTPFYVTNILAASTPTWGGNIKAWNSEFIYVDANGVSNDVRLVVVSSALTPTMPAQVQDLILHNTNSLVISDTFNIIRTLSVDAQSLTLTTNPPGNDANSFDGELNLDSVGIFWQSSTPNLHYLTNNGAIRMQNLAFFGHPFYTNVTAAVAAVGSLAKTSTGTNVVQKDLVTVGTNQYVFVSTLTNSLANQVQIVPGASVDGSLSNLIAAINGGSGAGTAYSSATQPNSMVAAGLLTNHAFVVRALSGGTVGNTIATGFTPATKSTNLTWSGQSTLVGGANSLTNMTPFLNNTAFINHGIFEDQGSIIYAGNFTSSGVFSNGTGSFTLQSLTTTLTNGVLSAQASSLGPVGGDVSITTGDLVISNLMLEADRSLTLLATNQLVDTGVTNNSFWEVGSASVGVGITVPFMPTNGSLLGTTIHLSAPTNYTVVNVWPGVDLGASPAGFSNNLAVGQLILDVATPAVPNHNGVLSFNGAGASNALYVDLLVLTNYATQGNGTNSFNFPWLSINTNMVVYFGQALENGVSVAENIDNVSRNGGNNGRLHWVYSYAGYLSGTNLVYTNLDGSTWTNTVNAALATSKVIDSDGDGLPNYGDPTPFLLSSEIKVTAALTSNNSQKVAKVMWGTIPNATNFVWYTTNFPSTTNWLPFTSFQGEHWFYYSNDVLMTQSFVITNIYLITNNLVVTTNSVVSTNMGFVSPPTYVHNASLPDNSQQTNVWVFDVITNVPHYYKVEVSPWLNYPE